MSNPIMQRLNHNAPTPKTGNNPMQLLQQFQQFAKGMSPQQAQQIIMQKLNSGEISKEQFENAKRQAQAFANMFGIK